MKNKITMMAAAVAALMSVTASVQAVPITGNIGFTGLANLNTGTAATATTVNSYTATSVLGGSGYIATLAPSGTAVTFAAPWTFLPGGGGPITPFWTSSLANGLTFSLTTWSAVTGSSGGFANVAITGYGWMSDAIGDTSSLYSFSVTLQDPNTSGGGPTTPSAFTFSASQAPTPDGGMTLLLLGAALTGLFLVRKQVLA